jgi:aminoglycoside 2''-phosphotransferase
VSILRAIRGRVALPTPDPTYDNLATRTVATTFIGYPRLSGEPLRRDLLIALDDRTRFALAVQVARFLETLPNLPGAVYPRDLSVQDGYDHWADLYGRIRDKLFPLMGPQGRATLADHFESYLAETDNSLYQPVLRHGDFGPTNILFDSVSRTISGIVEFGSAGLGD